MPPEMPEEFPEPPLEESLAEAAPVAEVVEDTAPVASLESPQATDSSMADQAEAETEAEPVAREGDTLPVRQPNAEAVPAA